MAKLLIAVFTGLFILGLGSVSFAGGMLDQVTEATGKADTAAKDAKAKADSAEQKSIEAQSSSQEQSGSLVDQAKDAAKKTTNEKIDNLGK